VTKDVEESFNRSVMRKQMREARLAVALDQVYLLSLDRTHNRGELEHWARIVQIYRTGVAVCTKATNQAQRLLSLKEVQDALAEEAKEASFLSRSIRIMGLDSRSIAQTASQFFSASVQIERKCDEAEHAQQTAADTIEDIGSTENLPDDIEDVIQQALAMRQKNAGVASKPAGDDQDAPSSSSLVLLHTAPKPPDTALRHRLVDTNRLIALV
jgi:hypothetical protein